MWVDLYRAVDSQGNTLEFLLSPKPDAQAATCFFLKALAAPHTSTPGVITVATNAAYPKAFKELKAEGLMPSPCELRQRKYLNNLIEQDHRAHQTAGQAWDGLLIVRDRMANPCRGYEAMNMLRKGQIRGVAKRDSLKQATFFANLFGVAI
jgi:transposase, IS6 family